MQRKTGEFRIISTVGGENCTAFLPKNLPPDPPLRLTPETETLMERALLALGRLDSISMLLPDTSLFLYMYIRKEAVLSSQIEGTQSSLSDLLLYEHEATAGVQVDDILETSNYVRAILHGIDRHRKGFPLSLRLIREMHQILLESGRGKDRDPGEFRRTQNWIGGTRPGNAIFVPPPPELLMSCLDPLEKFIHDDPVRVPVLIKAALAHAQFETIHPFLDGNGRLGRLLVTLLLVHDKVLADPLLYLSLYFKRNREEYYRLLQQVRENGDWEEWINFFMRGILDTAEQAVGTARKLVALFDGDRAKIQSLGKGAGSALRVHHVLQRSPLLSIAEAGAKTPLSFPAAHSALRKLVKLGIVSPLPKRNRSQRFGYKDYLAILEEGTEPLSKAEN